MAPRTCICPVRQVGEEPVLAGGQKFCQVNLTQQNEGPDPNPMGPAAGEAAAGITTTLSERRSQARRVEQFILEGGHRAAHRRPDVCSGLRRDELYPRGKKGAGAAKSWDQQEQRNRGAPVWGLF